MRDVAIVSAVRTPIGSFGGALSTVPATKLGAVAIKAAVEAAGVEPGMVSDVLMGMVLQADAGQAPARQAALGAGLPTSVRCSTINKVCASSLETVAGAARQIMIGESEVVVAGGMEAMSLVPYYLPRGGFKMLDQKLPDGIWRDALIDPYGKKVMGVCGELCAKKYGISREQQDAFAIESYKRAQAAWQQGKFAAEVVPVEIPQRKGVPIMVTEDEEPGKVRFDKIPGLRPVFDREEGTITAANASTLNDGAAAVVMMSADLAEQLGLQPLAIIRSWAAFSHEPEWFTTAPEKAVRLALERASLERDTPLTLSDVDLFELNEAFSVVGIVNTNLLEIDSAKVNVNGGAVALGHPVGASGARILVTMLHEMGRSQVQWGVAGICHGGGGAVSMVVERPS